MAKRSLTPASLTVRQREVLELRVLGLSWPAIARKLRVSMSTVRQHYEYAMEKCRQRAAWEAYEAKVKARAAPVVESGQQEERAPVPRTDG